MPWLSHASNAALPQPHIKICGLLCWLAPFDWSRSLPIDVIEQFGSQMLTALEKPDSLPRTTFRNSQGLEDLTASSRTIVLSLLNKLRWVAYAI